MGMGGRDGTIQQLQNLIEEDKLDELKEYLEKVSSNKGKTIKEVIDDGNLLHVSAEHNRESIVSYLINQGADIDRKNQGETAMDVANRCGHDKIVSLLNGSNNIKGASDIVNPSSFFNGSSENNTQQPESYLTSSPGS